MVGLENLLGNKQTRYLLIQESVAQLDDINILPRVVSEMENIVTTLLYGERQTVLDVFAKVSTRTLLNYNPNADVKKDIEKRIKKAFTFTGSNSGINWNVYENSENCTDIASRQFNTKIGMS